MKTQHTALAMIAVALILGMAAVSLTSGCGSGNRIATNDPPPIEKKPSSDKKDTKNTTDDEGKKSVDDADGKKKDTPEKKDSPEKKDDNPKPKSGDPEKLKDKPEQVAVGDKTANAKIVAGDWPQWGGTSYRNNVPVTGPLPITWNPGGFDRQGKWIKDGLFDEEKKEWKISKAVNIKWVAPLGSQTYGNAVVAGGRIFVGTNNSYGHLKRYPGTVDLGCLVCFQESDGKFLWQHSSEKLPSGRVHDWPDQGICCAALVEGDRLWFVSSRGHVICLDTQGYYDDEDDGPVKNEKARLFVVAAPNDPDAENHFGAAKTALQEGKLSDYMRSEFARVDLPLPDDVMIQAEEGAKNKWSFVATIDGKECQFEINLQGPKVNVFKTVTTDDKFEADTVWDYDMMKELGISQHNMCSCSVTALGDILFVNTSNGVDVDHQYIPAPDAPSFIAMDKNTSKVLWTDKSPGLNILHGQWSSPTAAVLGGVPQVIFAGGDGWVYSFKADAGKDGKPTLLWKFDANPKTSKWELSGRGTRNNIIATPVVYDGLVYVTVGQDPEHGEGEGHLWCIDPTKRGDVSAELAVKVSDRTKPIPHKRLQAVDAEDGDVAIDNPNSAVVWHYAHADRDLNGDERIDFEETMHRSCGTVAIKDDILFIADFSGLFHCLDAKTGKAHWSHDMLAETWGSPLIADGKVYMGDGDGDVSVFNLSADPKVAMKEIDGKLYPINAVETDGQPEVTNMLGAVYSTPIVANSVLYITSNNYLFAIQEPKKAAEATGE